MELFLKGDTLKEGHELTAARVGAGKPHVQKHC